MTVKEAQQIVRLYDYKQNDELLSKYNIALAIIAQAIKRGYSLTKTTKHENRVDHPKHYNASGKKECIVEMQEMYGKEATTYFCLLNAYKYLYRKDMKGNKEEDIDKAKWYLMYVEQHLEPTPDILRKCKDLLRIMEVAEW